MANYILWFTAFLLLCNFLFAICQDYDYNQFGDADTVPIIGQQSVNNPIRSPSGNYLRRRDRLRDWFSGVLEKRPEVKGVINLPGTLAGAWVGRQIGTHAGNAIGAAVGASLAGPLGAAAGGFGMYVTTRVGKKVWRQLRRNYKKRLMPGQHNFKGARHYWNQLRRGGRAMLHKIRKPKNLFKFASGGTLAGAALYGGQHLGAAGAAAIGLPPFVGNFVGGAVGETIGELGGEKVGEFGAKRWTRGWNKLRNWRSRAGARQQNEKTSWWKRLRTQGGSWKGKYFGMKGRGGGYKLID